MSLPYSFPAEQFNNVPNGLVMSNAVNSYQITQKNGNNSVYVNKSTMDAYYVNKYGSNSSTPIPVYQFKSQQERIAALLGKLSVQCGQF
jgi:hypothetical protein